MSIGSLSTTLLLPPANLFLAGLVCWGIAWRAPRIGMPLLGICLILLLALGLPLVSKLLTTSLEANLPRVDPVTSAGSHPPGAIVVLSGEQNEGQPEGGLLPGINVGRNTLERMRAGMLLEKRTHLPVLLAGGLLPGGDRPIAEQMAQTMRDDYGIDARWLENRSVDTWENAQFSAEILKRDGISRIYLVTHAWHMRRANMAFAHFGIDVVAAPTLLNRGPTYVVKDFLPSVVAWTASSNAIHEWLGCLAYSFRR